MFDPEEIIHRRSWRERKLVHTEIPEFSLDYFSSSSSQVSHVQGPESTVGDTDYYSDSPPRGGVRIRDDFHPTPEVEEVKEVTEVSAINSLFFTSTPQAVVQYIPIVIHTSLPPLPPPFTHQNLALLPPPPMANVPGFLLNKYSPLELPLVLNDMPQDYLKILPRFNGKNEIEAQKHLEVF